MENQTPPSFRTATELDLPFLAACFVELAATYNQLGYLLPQAENIGEAWVDSFRRTLGRFSNVFLAEIACDDRGTVVPGGTVVPNRKIVGFALCRLKRVPLHMGGVMVGELSDIWISPQARRFGLGTQLTRLVLDWLREQGAHSVEVQVLRDNEAAWKMFERMGFQLEYRAARLLFDPAKEEILPKDA